MALRPQGAPFRPRQWEDPPEEPQTPAEISGLVTRRADDSLPPNVRETCALLITVTFDKKRYTMEEAWGMLSSTEIPESNLKTGVLNNLTANLRDIFGPLCKITVKEAQEDGYPAPHLIVLLDNPTTVRLHRGKGGQSWRISDPRTLRRIGKDPALRRLSRIRHADAISLNPIWKYGFIDVQGIVKGYRFKNRKDAVIQVSHEVPDRRPWQGARGPRFDLRMQHQKPPHISLRTSLQQVLRPEGHNIR